MRIFHYFFCIFFVLQFTLFGQQKNLLLTVAEKTEYQSTSTNADVLNFINSLKKQSKFLRVEVIAKSNGGNDIPLLIIGKPLPKNPADLKNDKRVVVHIEANIHAGEVEGKEATLMLARDILSKSDYLDKIIILICPNYNPDGNDKISKNNRRSQVGPVNGVGDRYNNQNLDLNRDGSKSEAPETVGLIKNILNRWDPYVFVDCHTTNGSYHEEPVTFGWASNSNISKDILSYMRNKMMPKVLTDLENKYKTMGVYYGEYVDQRDPSKGWEAFGHEPRYVVNYIGLRNRISILNENYNYSDFKTRVLGCYNLLRSILDFVYENKDEIKSLIKSTDEKVIARGINLSPADSFAIEYQVKAFDEKVTLRGYESETYKDENGRTRTRRTDRKKTYVMPYFADYAAKRSVRIPYAYIITSLDPVIINALNLHGIKYERLSSVCTYEVESFKIDSLKPSPRLNQGHYNDQIKGSYFKQKKEFPIGSILVPTSQSTVNIICYLLEPETDDGLLYWNYLDRSLAAQWGGRFETYPIHRLIEKPIEAK